MDTVDQLKTLIHEQFDVDPATIDADAPFASYKLDSLTVAELIFAIEDNFHVTVPDEAVTTVTTLRGMAQMLDTLVAAKPA